MATTTYLDRFLEPMTEALTPEVARVIADLRVDPETEAEVQRLRERANEERAIVASIVIFLRTPLRSLRFISNM